MTRNERTHLLETNRRERRLERKADKLLAAAGEVIGTVPSPIPVGGLNELAVLEEAGRFAA